MTHTVPDNSQQNTHAERANLTLMNLVRAVLCATAVPTYLWCYLLQAVCCCLNKTVPFNGKRGEKSRDELYDGIRPNVGHLRAIGCGAYGKNRSADDMKHGKLHERATGGVLIGYEESHKAKAYLIYHWETRNVKKYRVEDVQFLEHMMPFQVGRLSSLVPGLPDLLLPQPQPQAHEEDDVAYIPLPGDNIVYLPEEAEELPHEHEQEEEKHITTPADYGADWNPTSATDEQQPDRHQIDMQQPTDQQHADEHQPIDDTQLKPKLGGRPRRNRKQAPSSTATPSAKSLARTALTHGGDSKVNSMVIEREPAMISKESVIAFETTTQDIQAPTSYNDIKGREDEQLWYDAVEAELQNMEKMRVWQEVPRTDVQSGEEVISSQWILTVKRDSDGSILRKARMVACGNQELFTNLSAFSPTSRPQTLRLLLSLAAQRNLKIEHWDVKSAYLEAKLDQQVYLRPPQGVTTGPNALLKLFKAIYGLRRAGRLWNQTLHAELVKLGFTQSKHDPCLYFKGDTFILVYVDDILSAHKEGDEDFERIRKSLFKTFRMKQLKLHSFLGVEISQDERGIFIHQSSYCEAILRRHDFVDVKAKPTPLANNIDLQFNPGIGTINHPYRQLVGELFYLVTYTRPDIAQAVNYLARFTANPKEEHWKSLKRILRYLRSTTAYGLMYKQNNNNNFHAYSDSDFAGDKTDYKSTSGFLAMLGESVIDYSSVKQKTVARSSCEAEYVAAGAAACNVLFLRSLLLELGVISKGSTTIKMDSQSAIQLALKEGYAGRTRHIGVQHHYIRDLINCGMVQLEWVATTEMYADIFTKALDQRKFERIRDTMMCPMKD